MIEDKSTRYHRLRRRAGLLGLGVDALACLLLVASGLARWAADTVAGLAGVTPGAPSPLVAAVLGLGVFAALSLPGLPIAAYAGHVLDRRYGLTTERWTAWGRDHAKGLGLGAVFAMAAAATAYAAIAWWPRAWWLAIALAFTLFALLLTVLAPVLLLPLFHTVTPLRHAALEARLVTLARRAGTPVVGAFEWHMGAHTSRANAALAGLGRTRRILLSDTLLGSYSEDEIAVVLAHELSHHVHHDLWRGLALHVGLLAAGALVVQHGLDLLAPLAGLRSAGDPAGLPLLLLLAGAWSVLVAPLGHAMSRAQERRADRYALELTRDPAAFVTAMKRLGQQNLAEESPTALVRALFLSHPPIAERIAAARAWAAAVAPASRGRAMVTAEDR